MRQGRMDYLPANVEDAAHVKDPHTSARAPVPGPGPTALAVARREVRCIDRALGSRRDLDASVHSARKAIRRLRSLLGLCRDRLAGLAGLDRRLKALGAGLAVLRDAHVSIRTAQWMAKRHGDGGWAAAIERLVERRQAIVDKALSKDPGFQRRRARLKAVARQLETCSWQDLSVADIRHAIKSSEKRVAKAGKRATATPDADNLHRWRRRVRRLRMQLQAAAEIAPGSLASASRPAPRSRAKALHRLSDELGRRQDLEVLMQLLKPMRQLEGKRDMLGQIRGEIAALQSD